MKGVLVIAVICLSAGIGVIFGFCNGTTGMSLGSPLSASSIHIDITTIGSGVPIALGLVAVGAFLLLIATIIALIGLLRRKGEFASSRRREAAFEE